MQCDVNLLLLLLFLILSSMWQYHCHAFPGDTTVRGRGLVPPESQGVALVELSASLVSPGVQVTPSLGEVQEAIGKVSKIILSTAKGVSQWVRCRKEDVSIPVMCFEVCVSILYVNYISTFACPSEPGHCTLCFVNHRACRWVNLLRDLRGQQGHVGDGRSERRYLRCQPCLRTTIHTSMRAKMSPRSWVKWLTPSSPLRMLVMDAVWDFFGGSLPCLSVWLYMWCVDN